MIVLNIIKFAIGLFVFIFVFENTLVPLLHHLPRAIRLTIRGELRPAAILAVGWTALSAILVFAVVLLVVAHFYPGMWRDAWLNASSTFALVAVITWKFLYRGGRAETKLDFAKRIQPFMVRDGKDG